MIFHSDSRFIACFLTLARLRTAGTDNMGYPCRGSVKRYLVYIAPSSAGSVFCSSNGYLSSEEYCEFQPLISVHRRMFKKTSDCGEKNLQL